MATSKIGGGLKMVAKRAFDEKVRSLANPVRGSETYAIVNGKVRGVPLNIVLGAVCAARNSFTQTADVLIVAKRK